MSAELLAESLKKLLSIKDPSVVLYRAFGWHPCSMRAYISSHVGGLIESSREREYNIKNGNEEDSIPLGIHDAWVYLSEHPSIAEKYIKKGENDYFYFSQEIIIKLASELPSELPSELRSELRSELPSE